MMALIDIANVLAFALASLLPPAKTDKRTDGWLAKRNQQRIYYVNAVGYSFDVSY